MLQALVCLVVVAARAWKPAEASGIPPQPHDDRSFVWKLPCAVFHLCVAQR